MITANQEGNYVVSLSNGVHRIEADIAKDLGGDDTALNPHEIVEAALAACTMQTLLLYASRKKWSVPDLKVEVKIINEGPESNIDCYISFGNIPADQKAKLCEIANKCPIHKLLKSYVSIDTHEK